MKNLLATLLILIVLSSGCAAPGEAVTMDTRKVADSVHARFGDHKRLITASEKAGVDYLDVITRCICSDKKAMHHLFGMSTWSAFDGAAAEKHARVMGAVLREVGDGFFAKCLSGETKDIQGSVREDLIFDFCRMGVSLSQSPINRFYPIVFKNAKLRDIQAMINNAKDGSVVNIKRGRYILKSSLRIKDRKGLTIKCEDGVRVLASNEWMTVLAISDSTGIKIENMYMRHINDGGHPCAGAVLSLGRCKNIKVFRCEINGCGHVGVSMGACEHISFSECFIHHNTGYAIQISNSKGVEFTGNTIEDNAKFIYKDNVENMVMKDNIVRRNGDEEEGEGESEEEEEEEEEDW